MHKPKSKVIAGLDVSTKTIGVTFFFENGKLARITHLTPKVKPKPQSNEETLIKKSSLFRDFLLQESEHYDFSRVFIEEPLLNSNNVYTVATLMRFNGMISQHVYDITGVVPEFISSYDARKYAYPELMAPNAKGKPVLFGAYPKTADKKSIVWEKVAEREPQVNWTLDKKKVIAKENYDAADSYTCALGAMRKLGLWK